MNKLKLFILLLVIFNIQVHSQPSRNLAEDSLFISLQKKPDSKIKINQYALLSHSYVSFDLAGVEKLSVKLLELSARLHYDVGIAHYYDIISIVRVEQGRYTEAITAAKKASDSYLKLKLKKEYLSSVNTNALALLYLKNDTAAVKLAQKGLLMAEGSKHYDRIAFLHFTLACSYGIEKNYDKVLSNLTSTDYYLQRATLQSKLNSFTFPIAEIYPNPKIVVPHNSINHKLYDGQEISQLQNRLVLFMILSDVYLHNGDFKKALIFANNSYETAFKIGNPEPIFRNLIQLSEIYYASGDFKKSILLSQKALLEYDKIDNQFLANRLLGNNFFKLNDYKKAKFYQQKAVAYYENKQGEVDGLRDNYKIFEEFALTNLILKDKKNAYDYYNKFFNSEREQLTAEKEKKIDQLQKKFDIKNKEVALQKLLLLKNSKDIALKNQKSYLVTVMIILVIVIVILVLVFKIDERNKNKNKILNEISKKIEENKYELQVSQNLISKALREKEMLLKEVHHRVKNNLQLILSLLNIQAKAPGVTDVKDFLEKGQSRIMAMALIHQNLYETNNSDKVSFQAYLENLINSLRLITSTKNKSIQFDLQTNQYFDIETSIPLGLIVHEIICTRFKHSSAENNEEKISIVLKEIKNGTYELHFSDTGVIISNHRKTSKSLDLPLIELLLNQLNGNILFNDSPGNRCTITFQGNQNIAI